MNDLGTSPTLMTNTHKRHKFIIDDMQVYYPGSVSMSELAYTRDGDHRLYDHIAVHTGPKPLDDYGEFWRDFSRLLTLHGVR